MAKAVILYLAMLMILVVGLWGVIHLGRHLRAPHDISGVWTVTAQPSSDEGPSRPRFSIEQSGQFLKLYTSDGQASSFTLAAEETSEQGAHRLVFQNGEQKLIILTPKRGDDSDAAYQFQFRGPLEADWPAQRAAPDEGPAIDKNAAKPG